ncbi:MAG: PKD domain-containing protein [Thermoplasmata archaeon]|nr:PKD domain-containing protein [Thermoplasmata archaeon]
MSRGDDLRSAASLPLAALTTSSLLLLAGLLAAPFAISRPSACGFTVAVSAQPSTGATPLVVHFNASVSSGVPTGYNWSFGDGSYWNSSFAGAATPLHRYAAIGLFLAHVGVSEGACSAGSSISIGAVAGPLTVVLLAHPLQGGAPLTVTFNATVAGGSGTYTSATWRFGDGGVGSGLNVEYTYSRTGAFTAVLNVTDSSGHWGVASANLSVGPDSGTAGGLRSLPVAAYLVVAAAAAIAVALLVYRRVRGERAGDSSAPPHPTSAAAGVVPEISGPGLPPPPPMGVGPSRRTEPPGPGVPALPVPPRSDRLQLTQRVILHIGAQGLLGPDDVAPFELTQGGMVEHLRASQNTVTNVLRRLVAAGVLSQEVRHVQGRPRRLRVYRFTGRGESIYRDLRTSLADAASSARRGTQGAASPPEAPTNGPVDRPRRAPP